MKAEQIKFIQTRKAFIQEMEAEQIKFIQTWKA